ncbi:MAG: pilus assembly protein PilM [Proteobacteria bacterium]|nr:pilus assembly protein PilM [Pseudomonadota bacterium]
MFFKTRRDVFGLDIGSHSIKLIELKKGKKEYKLKTAGIKLLPKDTIIDGSIMDSTTFEETVRSLLAEAKPSTKFVALSVSGQSVIVKKINVPFMTEEEFANSIQWETEQYLPFNIQDVYCDFKILGESSEIQGQLDVLLVAAKKDLVDDYQNAVRAVGLEPLVVDVDVFALQNMYELNEPLSEDKIIMLVNMGASFTNINIIKNGLSLFTRDIIWGGNKVTEALQKNLGITFEDAELVKCGKPMEGIDINEVSFIINQEIDGVVNEINRTISFFNNANPNDVIDKIVLYGGTAQLRGLVDALREKLGLVVEIGNPFNRIIVDNSFWNRGIQNYALQTAIAVGLAIRRLGDR